MAPTMSSGKFRLGAGFLGVVRVADRLSQITPQLVAVQNDLLRMDCLDGIEWHDEVSRILDVDHHLRPAMWCDLTDCTKHLATISNKYLISYLDLFSHTRILQSSCSLARLEAFRMRPLMYSGIARSIPPNERGQCSCMWCALGHRVIWKAGVYMG